VIIIIGLKGWTNATSAASEESIKVELFSKQFDWTARYAGADNKLGKFDYKLTVDDNNPLALMTTATIDTSIRRMEAEMEALEAELNDENIMLVPKDREAKATDLSRKERLIRLLHQMKARHDSKIDASAWDDIVQKDTLYLCVDQEYEFNFRSKDVIHSAYFPHFRAQMNTVPGMTTRFKFTPNKTTAEMRVEKNLEDFNYILMCNKICGGAHYKMKMMVVVLEKKDYDKWMKSKANATFKDGYFAAAAVEEAPAENDEDPAEGGEPVEGVEAEEEPVAPVE